MSLLVNNVENLCDLLAKSLCIASYFIVCDRDFDNLNDPLFETWIEKYKSVDFFLTFLSVQPLAAVFVPHEPQFFSDGQTLKLLLILISVIIVIFYVDYCDCLLSTIFLIHDVIAYRKAAVDKLTHLFLLAVFGFEAIHRAVG